MAHKRKMKKKHLTLKVMRRKAKKLQNSKHQEHRIKDGKRKQELEALAGDA